jgi:hypothetical protein
MKNMKKQLLAITMLLSTVELSATTFGQSYFLPRAQNGTAVDVLGWSPEINKYDADSCYFDFKAQSEYRQTFRSSKLGQYIFFNNTDTMNFGTAGATTDVNAVNFLLPTGFVSNVTASPKVQSSITDFSIYVGLDGWVSGLFMSAHLPLVYTRWNTHLSETVVTAGNTAVAAGIYDVAATTAPYADVIAAWKGDKVVGDITNVWSYGVINGAQHHTKVGDIALNLGYNFVNRENMYFGFGVRGLFGCGGHSKAQYVFEPTVGYAGRMGVGGFLQGQARIWERDEDHRFVATFFGYAEHLFNSKQTRSFDLLQCGAGSRYNLVKKLTTPVATPAVYSGVMDNMINVGTQQAKIGIGVVYEADLQLSYMMNNVNFDLGYSVGGHSKEKFSSFTSEIAANTYILYSAGGGANVSLAQDEFAVPSIAVNGVTGGAAVQVTAANTATYCISNDGTLGLNTASALAPSVVSNNIYGNIGYTWRDNDWCPNVSIFGDVEFANNKSLSTWGIGLQGNVSY